MKKGETRKLVKVALDKKEIDYLTAVVEAQANKILVLGERQQDTALIKREFKIISGLEKKLSIVS